MRLYRTPKKGKVRKDINNAKHRIDDTDVVAVEVQEDSNYSYVDIDCSPEGKTHYPQHIQLPQPKKLTLSSSSSSPLHDQLHCTSEHYYHYIPCDNESEIQRYIHPSTYYNGQNVWVCKSKGSKKGKSSSDPVKNNFVDGESLSLSLSSITESPTMLQRLELFSRAIVMEDKTNDNRTRSTRDNSKNSTNIDSPRRRRICVKYPLGSTYHVRSDYLIPIYDNSYIQRLFNNSTTNDPLVTSPTNNSSHRKALQGLVLIYPETNDYRRACKIHTMQQDHFIEIGCAEGHNCSRINNKTSTSNPVETNSKDQYGIVLGIDKSISCIQTAQENCIDKQSNSYFISYDIFQPTANTTTFSTTDATSTQQGNNYTTTVNYPPTVQTIISCLTDGYNNTFTTNSTVQPRIPTTQGMTSLSTNCCDENNTAMKNNNIVIAIDINGNRDLQPILKCLQIVMNCTLHPRLIIVKSRSLYQYIKISPDQPR